MATAEQYLVVGQVYGPFNDFLRQVFAFDGKHEMDFGENFGVGIGAFTGNGHVAMGNVLAAAFQDKYHVVGSAAGRTGQDHFHRSRGQVVAAAFWGAIHGDNVATAGF